MTECSAQPHQYRSNSGWRRWLVWLPTAVWMALIFLFSAQPADDSAAVSGKLLGWLLNQLMRWLPNLSLDQDFLHHLIRKTAHFVVYAVLGSLTLYAVKQSRYAAGQSRYAAGQSRYAVKQSRLITTRWPVKRTDLFWAWLISTLYAVTDELHQIIVPGRSGEFRDIVLDSSGALTGIIILVFVLYWQWRRRQRRSVNN